jgi:hypothetical protein
VQPFNCEKLLYTDYARLPEAKEKELGVTYVKVMDDFVKYGPVSRLKQGVPLRSLPLLSLSPPPGSLPRRYLETEPRVTFEPVLDGSSASPWPLITDA